MTADLKTALDTAADGDWKPLIALFREAGFQVSWMLTGKGRVLDPLSPYHGLFDGDITIELKANTTRPPERP